MEKGLVTLGDWLRLSTDENTLSVVASVFLLKSAMVTVNTNDDVPFAFADMEGIVPLRL